MNIDAHIITFGGILFAVALQAIHMTIIYTKLRNKLDGVARNCIHISDLERWARELDDVNPQLKVPDITKHILARRALDAAQEES